MNIIKRGNIEILFVFGILFLSLIGVFLIYSQIVPNPDNHDIIEIPSNCEVIGISNDKLLLENENANKFLMSVYKLKYFSEFSKTMEPLYKQMKAEKN